MRKKKKPDPAPTMDEWTASARKIEEAQAADKKAAPAVKPAASTPTAAEGKEAGKKPAPPAEVKPPFTEVNPPAQEVKPAPQDVNGQPDKPLAGPIDAVLNRVKKALDTGADDWEDQRRAELRDIAERRHYQSCTKQRLKGEFAAASKALDALDVELLEAVRNLEKPYPPKPARLYPDPAPAGSSSNARPAEDDKAWRSVPLASLHLPKGILEKLAKPINKRGEHLQPIRTLGDLTDFQKPLGDYEPRLTDLKGLGKTAVDKITAATDQYWAEHAQGKKTRAA